MLPFFEGHLTCAVCKIGYGVRTGDAPAGYARLDFIEEHLPGYSSPSSNGHFVVEVCVQSGVQRANHPTPGHRYHGKMLKAYFPHTTDGAGARVMLRVLEAHRRRLLFTIGQSATSGR